MNNNPYQGQYQAPQYSAPQYQAPQTPNYYNMGRPQNPAGAKSGFLTFCFAFVPGAGEMYLGHMKRGVSLSVLFFGLWWLSAMIIDGLWIALPVIWMYSFFDTFNLRGRLAAGTAEPDALLFHLEDSEKVRNLLEKRHTLIGCGLIVLGIWAVYDQFIKPAIWSLCNFLNMPVLADLIDSLPSLVLIIALILVGIWLVRGPQQHKGFVAQPEDDIQYYAADPEQTEQPAAPAENPITKAAQPAAPMANPFDAMGPEPGAAPQSPEDQQDDTKQ
ncbi:MAG: hypothetical protein LKJ90_06995 [Faecalibacterium sp.]|nr:hypothetical protein [Faecalibacterium sp.]